MKLIKSIYECTLKNAWLHRKLLRNMLAESTLDSDSQISWLCIFSKSQMVNTKIIKGLLFILFKWMTKRWQPYVLPQSRNINHQPNYKTLSLTVSKSYIRINLYLKAHQNENTLICSPNSVSKCLFTCYTILEYNFSLIHIIPIQKAVLKVTNSPKSVIS